MHPTMAKVVVQGLLCVPSGMEVITPSRKMNPTLLSGRSCTDCVKMEAAPCESGQLDQERSRIRLPREVLVHGGAQASRAPPLVGGAFGYVGNPSEAVGSRMGSPSSDQAKFKGIG